MTCPPGDQAAELPAHRPHTPVSLVGALGDRRASCLCRRGGTGSFPFDHQAGLSSRDLTPALERVTILAGAVADSFETGAERLDERAGVRLSGPPVERATDAARRRLADAVRTGTTFGPEADRPWPNDDEGRRCASVERDATGVRQQAQGGGPAEGRMASVGRACDPGPEDPWPAEAPRPMRARSLWGLDPLEECAPLLRAAAGHVGMDRADRGIGLSDGGHGLEDRLREDLPRGDGIILDVSHPAEQLTGLARRLYPEAETQAADPARQWRGRLKDAGGAILAAVWRAWAWPRRAGLSDAVEEVVGSLEHAAHRRESGESLARGGCIGSGAVEGACKTMVGQRLKLAGIRRGAEGANAVGPLRARSRSETGQWDAFWGRDFSPN